MKGILGRKIGMTQVFTNNGELVPVTVVSVEPNVVTQIRTIDNDGYEAVQLGFENKREKLATKASIGHTNKANTKPKRFFKEIRGVDVKNYTLGQEVKADIFVEGEVVDVTGTTKGKGFQGAIKRHNQTRGPMTHGSQYHRGVGSMGSRLPKRVMKGKKLPGHMGAVTVTIQNLEIIAIDLENNALLVKGNVPGPKKGLVLIRSSVKNPGVVNEFEGLISYDQALVETYDEIVNENPELVSEETPMVDANAEVEVENEKEEA